MIRTTAISIGPMFGMVLLSSGPAVCRLAVGERVDDGCRGSVQIGVKRRQLVVDRPNVRVGRDDAVTRAHAASRPGGRRRWRRAARRRSWRRSSPRAAICSTAGDVGDDLRPEVAPRAAADRHDARLAPPARPIVSSCGARRAGRLERRAVEVAAGVLRASGRRSRHGRAGRAAACARRRSRAARAGRRAPGAGGRRLGRGARRSRRRRRLAQPVRQRPGGRHAAGEVARARHDADGAPQRGAASAGSRHRVHEEHRRAVHQHQVAGARAPTLTASDQASIVPATTRGARRQPGRRGGVGGDRADQSPGHTQSGQRAAPGRSPRPVARSSPGPRCRRAACTGWPSDGRAAYLAGQPMTSEGARHEPAAVPGRHSGSCVGEPGSFGPAPGRQRGAAARTISSAPSARSSRRSAAWRGCRCRTGWPAAGAAARVGEQHARPHAR